MIILFLNFQYSKNKLGIYCIFKIKYGMLIVNKLTTNDNFTPHEIVDNIN